MGVLAGLSVADWIMLGAGAPVAALGLLALRRGRAAATELESHAAAEPGARSATEPAAAEARVSPATWLVLGVALVLGGYHLVAWALTPRVAMLAVPEDLWWAVVAGLGLLVALSRLLDAALDGGPGPDPR